jgi:hypothetical protein
MKMVKCPVLPVPGGATNDSSTTRSYMPIYNVSEFKPFLDQRKVPDVSENRVFCGECLKPRKMYSDDLEDVLSRSDFCQCLRAARRDHA